ncbi:MAG: DUF167 domain-containing protein, partial [Actinobacteria bacterium]|nr:DUF167 domain-containing protein [Actinomycetota bacterium]
AVAGFGAGVGGRYGLGDPPVLIVRVKERAVDGRANKATATALARAFGVSRDRVVMVGGWTGRTKVFEIDGAEAARLGDLLDS